MSAYNPPSVSLPIFDTLVFEPSDTPLTYSLAKKYFLTYPTAQGSETLQKVGQAIGNNNIQFGDLTSFTSTSGANNIAIGNATLPVLSSGNQNVAIGTGALNIATTGYDNTAVGYYALGDDVTTHNGVTAIGSLAGRHSIGSNSTYLGHQTGQQSTDASTYNYLTCIGMGSGREASVCASNRIILGSSTGSEDVLLAGNGSVRTRVLTSSTINLWNEPTNSNTINMFTGLVTSSTVNIGTNMSSGSIINIGTQNASSFGGVSAAGITLRKITANDFAIRSSAGGGLAIGDTHTTGNITLGNNNNNTDSGVIVLYRRLTLPTSTTYQTPTAGTMLGGVSTIAATLGSASFAGGAGGLNLVGSTVQNIASFTFPSVGTYLVKIRIVFSLAGGSSAKIGLFGLTSTSATMPTDPQVLDDYYYNGTLWNGSNTMMDFYGPRYTLSVTNAATTYYVVGQMGVNAGETITISSCSVMPMRIA